MDSQPALEKCPFCGGEAIITTHKSMSLRTVYMVSCVNCEDECSKQSHELSDAIAAWNRRVPAPQPQALDAPDSPGWWAAEIPMSDGNDARLVFQVRQDADGTFRYDDESRTHKVEGIKWTRLTMPWETPAP